MKSTKLSNLTENDVLSLDISTNDGCIILSKGTLLNKDFINKLQDFGIEEVFIDSPDNFTIETSNSNQGVKTSVLMPDGTVDVVTARQVTISNYCSIFSDASNENGISKEKLDESTTNIVLSVLAKIKDETLDILYTDNPYFCHYTHSLNTASLAVFLGTSMGLNDENLREVAAAALLHDIGMHKLPKEILEKSGNLTEEDVDIVKKHTIDGYETVSSIKGISESCKKAILHHHERYDGRGYPFKMQGKSIPLYSRIIAVADMFCSLTTKTVAHPGYSFLDTYEFMLASSGLYFDPDIIDVFQKHFVLYPIGTEVMLNNGTSGIVTSQNKGFPDRPNLKITKDKRGIEILPMTVNLIKKTNLKIDKKLT